MRNFLLRVMHRVATMIPYKWEPMSEPTFNPTKEPDMSMTMSDKIVNTFRDYTRRLASDVSRSTKNEQREMFSRARTVRQIAREAGLLDKLDRASSNDSATVRVFASNDYNWTKYNAA